MKFDVVLVGGGAVGTASAYAMARVGLNVALIERDTHVGRGASRGTACLATASHAERLASPEALREAVHFLRDPRGALAIRPSPELVFWLARFVTNALRRREAHSGTTLLQSM